MSTRSYRERLREEALAIACRIIEAEGLDAVQARRIARDADCAVGSLYNVYGDIDELIIAANSRTLSCLGAALNRAAESARDGSMEERLLALALAYAAFAVENGRAWDAVFRHRRAAGATVPDGYLADQARLLANLEAALVDRFADGEVRARVARALFGAVHGIVALAVDNRLGGAMRAELDAQLRFMVQVIVHGLPETA